MKEVERRPEPIIAEISDSMMKFWTMQLFDKETQDNFSISKLAQTTKGEEKIWVLVLKPRDEGNKT